MTDKELKQRREKWAKLPLDEQRQKMGELVNEQRTMLATAETREAGKQDLTAEESATYDGMDADVEALDANVNEAAAAATKAEERSTKLAEREEHLARRQREPLRPEVEDRGKDPKERAELIPAAWRKRYDPDVITRHEARAKAPYAKAFSAFLTALDARYELSAEEHRDLSVGQANAGGYAVPVQEFVPQLIRKLDDATPLFAKATKYEIPQAMSLGVPTLEANPDDGDWTSEVAVGGTDAAMAFGKRELNPWPIAKLLKVSRKLMRASPLNMEGIIRDRMAYKISIPLSKALNIGTGANQPLGIFVGDPNGIPVARDTTLLTSSAIDPDKLITMRHSIRDAYKNLTWVMHRTTLAAIRKLKGSATGNYMWQPGMGMMNVPASLLDFPYILDENAPVYATSGGTYLCALGDLSYIWAAIALNFDIQRLDELFAATNQVGFIVRAEIDAMPVLGDAFVRGTAT
jgi:HK97 family phage major capsid protein